MAENCVSQSAILKREKRWKKLECMGLNLEASQAFWAPLQSAEQGASNSFLINCKEKFMHSGFLLAVCVLDKALCSDRGRQLEYISYN